MPNISIAFVLSFLTMLIAGCGGESASSYEGQWTVDKAEMKAQVEVALKEQLKGIQEDLIRQQIEGAKLAIDQTSSSLRLNKGGTYSLVTTLGMHAQTRNGTWKAEGGSIVLSTPGQPDVTARIKGGKLLVDNPTGDGPKATTMIRVE